MERYEAYKDSGVEWIGEIPEEWEICKLKQQNSIAGRIGWQGLTSDEYKENGPFLITGINFSNGEIDWNSCVHITDERWQEATQIQIANNDLLITKDGTVGKVAFAKNLNSRASLNSGVMVIRPISTRQNMRYLFWILQSEVFWGWFADINSGNSTITHLYQRDFLNFCYLCPPLDEQQAITDFLDAKTAEIDGLVADCEREIELLQEYRKAVISDAVSKGLDPNAPMKDSGVEWIGEIPEEWETQRLKSLASNRIEPATVDSGTYIGLENVQSFAMKITHNDESSSESEGILYDNKCVLFGKLRPYLAKVALPNESGPCSSEFLSLMPDNCNREFLAYLLTSGCFIDEVNSFTYGVRMPRAGWDIIGKIRMPFPPLAEQQAIADYLDAKTAEIDSLIEVKQQMAEKLREYRKSLISEAVTGKFKVSLS